jgi:ubiquinone/menaquinone biosynthesis C-methylase UbiE
MDKKYARYLLKKTHKDYNKISENYDKTRFLLSDDIKKLSQFVNENDKVLDLGCANGKFFEAFKDKKIDYFGIDISENLIKIAKQNYPEANFQVADALNLPFPDNFFDKIYSISVLHNIPSKELRLKYLKEAKRVLKNDGFLILRVWDLWKRKDSLILILKYTFLKIIGKSKLDFFDIFLPWKDSNGKILANRYFHCFRKKELEDLLKKSGFKIIKVWKKGKKYKANIYSIAQK